MDQTSYDAVLILSFGGPEAPEQVMPFLKRVTAGKRVSQERLDEVAEHYYHFGGSSPINEQVRKFIAALKPVLSSKGVKLPLYWANRNSEPFVEDVVAKMAANGVQHGLAYATSMFSSYSGCRQYLEDIDRARSVVGPGAPTIDKLKPFWDHPGFLSAVAKSSQTVLYDLDPPLRQDAHVIFTAHSIPLSMASSCDYQVQLNEAASRVSKMIGKDDNYSLAYQSRSGPPQHPWLGPDIVEHLEALSSQQVKAVVVVPIGFVSDHMEVIYDLDFEARQRALELGMVFKRAHTVGADPVFVDAVAEQLASQIFRSGSTGSLASARSPSASSPSASSPSASSGSGGYVEEQCAEGCCNLSASAPSDRQARIALNWPGSAA